MGCDIHFVLEVHNPQYGWVGLFATDMALGLPPWSRRDGVKIWNLADRDYAFFANLAGVRGEGPDPLGLPEDASAMTRCFVDDWNGDGHSHSYASLRDFVVAKLRASDGTAKAAEQKLKGEDPVLQYLGLGSYDLESFGGIDQLRVCYWFDN